MVDQRLERAVQRIESALTRIAAVADAERTPPPAALADLVEKHERLSEAATGALKEIDDLIERLDR